MNFKYIIYLENDTERVLLFDKFTNHSAFVALKPISAGFVEIYKLEKSELVDDGCYTNEIGFNCYGKSVSLRLDSRPEDSKIIRNAYLFRM